MPEAGFVPVNEPLFAGNERRYLEQCIETGWISSEGPFVGEFEEMFARTVGRAHGVSVCNGTAALELAVKALGVGPGDEVIMPTFTIISCAAAVIRAGATPVLVDSDPDTWNMNALAIEERITERTRAIMAVHIYGLPVDMGPVLELARERGLKIIEDAAEAIGVEYAGKPCGGFGDISAFSFYANKLVTTGEGGMVATDDAHLAERCRSLRNLCFGGDRFVHRELGWNMRMSNLQAAVGLAQLERLDESIAIKKRMGKRYGELLGGLGGIRLPCARTDHAENVFWVYGVVLGPDVPFGAKEAMARMADHGIGTRPFFWPMHNQPVLADLGLFAGESYPEAETLGRRGFYLPCGLALTEAQMERAAGALGRVLG